MNTQRLNGLVAATYTPLDDDGAVNARMVGPMVEHLLGSGINGLYVGECRLPQGTLPECDAATLRSQLESIVFFGWSQTDEQLPA